jgi:hypothetical protein
MERNPPDARSPNDRPVPARLPPRRLAADRIAIDKLISSRLLREARACLPPRLLSAYAPLLQWIDVLLAVHQDAARPVAELGLRRVPAFFPEGLLREAGAIAVRECPRVPLENFGLKDSEIRELGGRGESGGRGLPPPSQTAGLTLRQFYFIALGAASDESTHFHELVHVVQWSLLGEECFYHLYGAGLLSAGYRSSPLEAIAYDLQARFDGGEARFDAIEEVRRALGALSLLGR